MLLLFWNLCLGLLARYAPDRSRGWLRWLAPLACFGLPPYTPLERLAAMSVFLLFALKASVLLGRPRAYVAALDGRGLLLYFSLWPGVDPAPFERRQALEFPLRWFVQGWTTMIVSAVAVGTLAACGRLNGWGMLFGLLGFVHLGYSDVLSALLRLAGFPVRRLFDNPLASDGLRDFWSRRWNRPFVDLNRLLLVGRQRVLAGFVVSGLLHEAALSFPVLSGWGGPLGYFVLQYLGMQLEGAWLSGWRRRLWTWAWVLLPLPGLFQAPFHQAFLEPLARMVPVIGLGFLLSCAGWGHFLVLGAGLQVPWRLGWREELSRLRPLNRKLLWVYYGYIGAFILTFGCVILGLHDQMLAGERGALTLLGIITVFWTARILVDALVFEHSDWPEGPLFGIGHTLLTSLFVFVALTGWLVLLSVVSFPEFENTFSGCRFWGI
ncbi:MAG: hypothetical protein KIS61_30690 [Candidatus Eremiobacteraeota bacterium]|nr:hypothetical protein [Candidatus Eremiobacteraeota bacterium]